MPENCSQRASPRNPSPPPPPAPSLPYRPTFSISSESCAINNRPTTLSLLLCQAPRAMVPSSPMRLSGMGRDIPRNQAKGKCRFPSARYFRRERDRKNNNNRPLLFKHEIVIGPLDRSSVDRERFLFSVFVTFPLAGSIFFICKGDARAGFPASRVSEIFGIRREERKYKISSTMELCVATVV